MESESLQKYSKLHSSTTCLSTIGELTEITLLKKRKSLNLEESKKTLLKRTSIKKTSISYDLFGT